MLTLSIITLGVCGTMFIVNLIGYVIADADLSPAFFLSALALALAIVTVAIGMGSR